MRISGITIPDNKRLVIGLTAVYGVGRSRSEEVLDALNIGHDTRPTELSADQEQQIRDQLDTFMLEGDLKREKAGNVKRLKDIQSYRGARHSVGLPGRGQRTKTNSRTVRGNVRKTMSSGRRKVEKK